MQKILIFDTTLRDGEQSPGASLTIPSKLEIARQLARLKVDVIEAGFPITSSGDFQAVEEISRCIKGPTICALARTKSEDIQRAYEALKPAKKKLIHTFIPASDIQINYQLRTSRDKVLKMAVEAVKYAKKLVDKVEFSAMDASRSNWDYLCKIFAEAIEAGATTVNIPDTVGYALPEEFGELISYIKNKVPNIHQAIISVHCHNDLGLATANTISAIKNGAQQVECTINGIGERAGNTSLEEVVMAINIRKDLLDYSTNIDTKQIYPTSKLVSELTGILVQPNKAIVGSNAFAHESGIHQDGVLKERLTYEIMKPELIGIKSNKIVLGKHSGRHAFRKRLGDLGFSLKESDLEKAFNRFKDLADKKKEIMDDDLIAIVSEEVFKVSETYFLEYLNVTSGTKTIPTATVKLRKDGEIMQEAACGDGPVDAACKAINRIVKLNPKLLEYRVQAVTEGTEALGEVTVKIKFGKDIFLGRGTSTDITEASTKAYLNAINKLVYQRNLRKKS